MKYQVAIDQNTAYYSSLYEENSSIKALHWSWYIGSHYSRLSTQTAPHSPTPVKKSQKLHPSKLTLVNIKLLMTLQSHRETIEYSQCTLSWYVNEYRSRESSNYQMMFPNLKLVFHELRWSLLGPIITVSRDRFLIAALKTFKKC